MTLDWITASDDLPEEGETVLLHMPEYQYPRPHLARLVKGDPSAEGEYYQRDYWMLMERYGNRPVLQTSHQWARIPAPEGVTWANVPTAVILAEQSSDPAPVTPQAPPEPAQPKLFGAAP